LIFDCVLHVLRDGEPHTFDSIMADLKSREVVCNEKQVRYALKFLAEYNFVVPLRDDKWRLTQMLVHFLQRIKELEG
jgi:repressor of nif and glnA expression